MNFIVSGLLPKSLINFELIFVYDVRCVQFHSFACEHPVFPALFVEKTVLSSLNVLGNLVENH